MHASRGSRHGELPTGSEAENDEFSAEEEEEWEELPSSSSAAAAAAGIGGGNGRASRLQQVR
jgi:hypothetical protein